jgi:uncharacterized protein
VLSQNIENHLMAISGKLVNNHIYTFTAGLFLSKICNMFGNLDQTGIDEVISSNIVGRIGCHADGKTYVVPISYVYDGECIYAHTSGGLKIDMMRRNPEVCFQVDSMEDMADWRSVIAWGTFEELTKADERNKGLQKLIGRSLPKIASETVKLSPEWPFPTRKYDQIPGIVFRICLHEKTGRFEKMDVQKK